MAAKEIGKFVKVNKISLDFENPRHDPFDTPEEVIEHLCKNEDVISLARDIARHGSNPLELLAVMPGKKAGTFISKEGNRRLCAIKLLSDPDLAPPNLRKKFEKLSDQWTPITELPVVEFGSQDQVDIWLQRIHNGNNKGVGRKQWTADQQARHSGGGKNKLALAVLDYAEKEGMITSDQRKNKITTVQRYLSNPLMREALGIDQSDPDGAAINRPEEDFKRALNRFIADLLDTSHSKISSRKNKPDIEAYARDLGRMKELSGETTDPMPIAKEDTGAKTTNKKTKPKKPTIPSRLPHDDKIEKELNRLNNYKLSTIYYSLCDISLPQHTPMLAVGVWAFVESLAAEIGSTTDMIAFFSNQKLDAYGFAKGVKRNGVREAIGRISKYGNTTKHDPKAAAFDSKQLANDFETIQPLILRCIEEAVLKNHN